MSYELDMGAGEPIAQCTVPPPGWSCSRGSGHTGPCAATAVVPPVHDFVTIGNGAECIRCGTPMHAPALECSNPLLPGEEPLSLADLAQIDSAWEKHKSATPDMCGKSDADLLADAVRNARSRRSRGYTRRWVAVMDTFACGSTLAHNLCARFGFDPDEEVRR